MSDIDPKIASIESQSLETHVVVNYERFKQIDQSISRIEAQILKQSDDVKEQIAELKKIVVWASSTLFGTLLIALLTSVFRII